MDTAKTLDLLREIVNSGHMDGFWVETIRPKHVELFRAQLKHLIEAGYVHLVSHQHGREQFAVTVTGLEFLARGGRKPT